MTARFSDDGDEVTLEKAGEVICKLHCHRVSALVRGSEGAIQLKPTRMLTTMPNLPLLAQRLYREHAGKQGIDPDAVGTSLFLAGMFRLICGRQWTLTGHDLLGHGAYHRIKHCPPRG